MHGRRAPDRDRYLLVPLKPLARIHGSIDSSRIHPGRWLPHSLIVGRRCLEPELPPPGVGNQPQREGMGSFAGRVHDRRRCSANGSQSVDEPVEPLLVSFQVCAHGFARPASGFLQFQAEVSESSLGVEM